MCIRDSPIAAALTGAKGDERGDERSTAIAMLDTDPALHRPCLLYTSDAADERSSVDLGGRRIIKKKNTPER